MKKQPPRLRRSNVSTAQLTLAFEGPRAELRARLEPLLVPGMRVVQTRNRVNLFSFRREGTDTEIRISERFAEAPQVVLEGAVRWARGGPGSRKAAATVRDYVRHLPVEDAPVAPRRMRSLGRVHDLGPLLTRAREAHVPEVEGVEVGWAPARRIRRRRGGGVRLASFQEATRIIRVHPALDDDAVLEWVLEFLLFHELLHARFGAQADSAGRLRYHTPEFNRAERAHPDYERFLEWEHGPFVRVLSRWDRGHV